MPGEVTEPDDKNRKERNVLLAVLAVVIVVIVGLPLGMYLYDQYQNPAEPHLVIVDHHTSRNFNGDLVITFTVRNDGDASGSAYVDCLALIGDEQFHDYVEVDVGPGEYETFTGFIDVPDSLDGEPAFMVVEFAD